MLIKAHTRSSPTQKCFQCQSDLILVKKWTEAMAGALFPQTTTIYRCSNVKCQEGKDKEEVKRKNLVKEKAVRLEEQAKRKLANSLAGIQHTRQ